MKKTIILVLILVIIVGTFMGCASKKEKQLANEIENMMEETEQIIEAQEDMEKEVSLNDDKGSGDDADARKQAEKLIPLGKDIKKLAYDYDVDEQKLYDFIIKLTVAEAESRGMSVEEYMDTLEVADSTPALAIEDALVALDMTLSEYIDMLNSTMDIYETEGSGEYSALEEKVSYKVKEVRDAMNSGMMYSIEYTTNASFDEACEYFDGLVKDTEGYMSMEGIMMGTIGEYAVQIVVEEQGGDIVVMVSHFK